MCIVCSLTYSALIIGSSLLPGLNVFVNGPSEGTAPSTPAFNVTL